MAEAGPGMIRLFNDFAGPEQLESLTATSHYIGQFRVVGEGFADNTVGIVGLESAGLSGVIRIESGATDQDSTGLVTSKMFDVALMGPIVMEARVQFNNLDTKEFFFGLSDVNEDDVALESDILGATAGTTIALTSSNLIGFLLDSELTEDEMWHMVYNGGATAGETSSSNVESAVDAVAGEWDVLRLEIDPNGDARWWVNGILKQSVDTAVSTTTDFCMNFLIGGRGANDLADVDYVLVAANRDWTV